MDEQLIESLNPAARLFCGYNAPGNPSNKVMVIKRPYPASRKRCTKRIKFDFKKLKTRYENQDTFEDIGTYFGSSAATVFNEVNRLIEEGRLVKRKRGARQNTNIPEDKFIEFYNNKSSYSELARVFNISRSKVQNYVQELVQQLKISPRRKKRE